MEDEVEIRLAILLEPGEFGYLRDLTKLRFQMGFRDPASDSHLQARSGIDKGENFIRIEFKFLGQLMEVTRGVA